MINRIIDFSVNNKFIVFALVAAACLAGWWSMKHVALDAIPDLSDTQVIIFSRWDRSPDIIEDQVTYPIVSAMVGAPRVKAVRGFSDFGYSYVYVIFEDGTDIYWARSRTQEYLSSVLPRLPQGVRTEMGPDATPLGWIFQYVLVDESGKHSLAELRSYQDWYLKYYLKAVPGVAEVAPVGGFGKQYQVNVDPNRLQAYGISINRVVEAVRERQLRVGRPPHRVRRDGVQCPGPRLSQVHPGPGEHRGHGQRYRHAHPHQGHRHRWSWGRTCAGASPTWTAKETWSPASSSCATGRMPWTSSSGSRPRSRRSSPACPPGVKIVPIYDRSDLILRSIDNLKSTVIEVLITVALVVFLFLWHIPSALIPVITLPVVILLSFIPFRMLGVTANIMSLGGIAIAIGAMVDAAIVVVEQTHKNLEQWERTGRQEDYRSVVIRAVKQVAGPSFFALLVIAVSFLPILDPGGPGRPSVQAPGLHQDPGHDHRRHPGHHPGPGPAAALHPHEEFQLPALLALPGHQCRLRGHHPAPKRNTPSAAS